MEQDINHNHDHHHGTNNLHDYLTAVNEYKKSFPSKQDVIQQTPDPAVREMLLTLGEQGIETIFDRFDQQKPQCSFGIAGTCCKNCSMGPCRITEKKSKGVCGADADLIVARNMLRALAAGAAAHGARGRETILALKQAAEGKIDLPILGEGKILATAKALGLQTRGRTRKQVAKAVANILLEDLSRTEPGTHKVLQAFSRPDRQKLWEDLDILPVSTYHEVFESLHRTSTGTDGDWENTMHQFLRTGLAFSFGSVLGTSIAMDSLFGLPVRSKSKVNLGALKEGYVNIAVHGHSPLLVSEITKAGQSDELQNLAKEHGAKGIQFYGICCSGLSAMYRYGNVIPLSNAVGSELVLGTGALDLWVADVQDVFPSIMEVARCFKTTVVTTSDSARLPGAEHYGLRHDYSNLSETKEIAHAILLRAIKSFSQRREVPTKIPPYEVEAEVGFSFEFITQQFGSITAFAKALKDGKIRGIVNLVGCNNPRVIYEKAIAEVADLLIANDILVLTNGCASFPLLKLGYCSTKALDRTGKHLADYLKDIPPVWHMGECLDNARASAIFNGISAALDVSTKDLPFAFASPEWSNEKGICAALSFRLLGMNSYHCVHAPVQGSEKITRFLAQDTKETLGSSMIVDLDSKILAEKIIEDIETKRKLLKWNEGESK